MTLGNWIGMAGLSAGRLSLGFEHCQHVDTNTGIGQAPNCARSVVDWGTPYAPPKIAN